MASLPWVSVIVPNYNHAGFLASRLESILQQTLSRFELIILDDASNDNSLDVIGKYLGDPRVRLHRNESNSGSPFKQWNRGVAAARGEFVWIAESDDYAEVTFLERLLPRFEQNPEVGLVYCQSNVVDGDGNLRGTMESWTDDLDPDRWRHPFVADGRSECSRYLIWRNTIPNASAAIFRREVYQRVGCAPTHLRLAGDWLTWVRILLDSDLAFAPEPLNYFRHHSRTVRSRITGRPQLNEFWEVQRFISSHCRLDSRTKRCLADHVVDEYYCRARFAPRGARRREFMSATWKFGPWLVKHPVTAGRALARFVRRRRRKADIGGRR